MHRAVGVKIAIVVMVLLGARAAGAAPIVPTSYDMNNGHGQTSSGNFNYWDLAYNGSGVTNADNTLLSGGLGDLTDGVIALDNWLNVENLAGTGPYVGWRHAVLPQPSVTFRFASPIDLSAITFYLDDSNGAGGVSPPLSIEIGLEGGPFTTFAVVDPVGSAPIQFVASNLSLIGSAFTVRFNYLNEWVFLSEVTFDGEAAAVPEPAAAVLATTALLTGILLQQRRVSRRRRTAADGGALVTRIYEQGKFTLRSSTGWRFE